MSKTNVLLAAFTALAALSGCQLALSTLSKRSPVATTEQPRPTESTERPSSHADLMPHDDDHDDEPAPQVSQRDDRTDEAPPSKPDPSPFVTLKVGERAPAGSVPSCNAPGRGSMCDGICIDVQVDANHCGICGNECDPGSRCDFSTCRDAEGNPD